MDSSRHPAAGAVVTQAGERVCGAINVAKRHATAFLSLQSHRAMSADGTRLRVRARSPARRLRAGVAFARESFRAGVASRQRHLGERAGHASKQVVRIAESHQLSHELRRQSVISRVASMGSARARHELGWMIAESRTVKIASTVLELITDLRQSVSSDESTSNTPSPSGHGTERLTRYDGWMTMPRASVWRRHVADRLRDGTSRPAASKALNGSASSGLGHGALGHVSSRAAGWG